MTGPAALAVVLGWALAGALLVLAFNAARRALGVSNVP